MADRENPPLTRWDGLCCKAALEGNAVNVAAYLKRGADVAVFNRMALLRQVAERGHIEVLRVLLDAGADINATSPKVPVTPLMSAARSGQIETMRFLLEHGASVGSTPEQRYRTLAWAVHQDNPEVFHLLLAAGIEIDARSVYGSTALMRAAGCGSVKVVKAMLAAGADVNAVSSNRMTALRCARRFGQPEMEVMLRQAGAQEVPSSFIERWRERLFAPLLRRLQNGVMPSHMTKRLR